MEKEKESGLRAELLAEAEYQIRQSSAEQITEALIAALCAEERPA